jgi:hypothetical protein
MTLDIIEKGNSLVFWVGCGTVEVMAGEASRTYTSHSEMRQRAFIIVRDGYNRVFYLER